MQQAGEYTIAAPRDAVWEALNDPEVLGACITGCQEVTRVDDQHFQMRVKAKIGPVSATFSADVELKDLQPPASYTLEGGVKGGAAGFGKGRANVELSESEAGGTVLKYAVDASVGGKLAQIGSRLVDAAARKMADEFFAAFSAHMSGPAVEEGATEAAAADASSAPKYERSGNRFIWLVAFVVLAMAMILAL